MVSEGGIGQAAGTTIASVSPTILPDATLSKRRPQSGSLQKPPKLIVLHQPEPRPFTTPSCPANLSYVNHTNPDPTLPNRHSRTLSNPSSPSLCGQTSGLKLRLSFFRPNRREGWFKLIVQLREGSGPLKSMDYPFLAIALPGAHSVHFSAISAVAVRTHHIKIQGCNESLTGLTTINMFEMQRRALEML